MILFGHFYELIPIFYVTHSLNGHGFVFMSNTVTSIIFNEKLLLLFLQEREQMKNQILQINI